ncbi:2-amino-4-hydroxy-6-hydroxymethyldihydropteridine diphosphokinase [Sedimenticola selenatireducens]|uniref:2-amino-4-hydroxy-6-hydroxymethyldihydropteridine diphosphokinase n=1 Tax=Sedimenticola selenatireducens TaxID=191960 RepID=A0A2N6CZ81_9GAMM|nr:2-amino-4-hydroxy-6-hydroxymethyldihydropteridine diphosphokinase [Sedimenticola selenatireducens]PLX62686.1 MAG: 2-amino-4-hydroxy-6-hydroxymethyldihydropteridine diphosphokinase [Sedimenticola selenatireducens]
MERIWLSLGSNIDRERNIRAALHDLQAEFGTLLISRIYESEAVGFAGDAVYNLVVGVDTDRPVEELIRLFRAIESAHGRTREGGGFAARTLDIDLLTYGDQIIDMAGVHLPRDEITRYAFVLLPLSELAGESRHPELDETYGELWRRFDRASQRLWPVPFETGLEL